MDSQIQSLITTIHTQKNQMDFQMEIATCIKHKGGETKKKKAIREMKMDKTREKAKHRTTSRGFC